jgi:hypothetical protein
MTNDVHPLTEESEDAPLLTIDGFEEALLGVSCMWDGHGRVYRLVYDGIKMLDIIMADGETSEEDAYDYVTYNCEGWYLGPTTPVIVWPYHGEDT